MTIANALSENNYLITENVMTLKDDGQASPIQRLTGPDLLLKSETTEFLGEIKRCL